MRRELELDRPLEPGRASDAAWFALAMLAGLVIGSAFLVLMIPAAIVTNVAALARRRQSAKLGG